MKKQAIGLIALIVMVLDLGFNTKVHARDFNSAFIMIDTSGEEVECRELIESNYNALVSGLNYKFLKDNNIRRVYIAVFNERVYPIQMLKLPRYGSLKLRFEGLSGKVRRTLNKIYSETIYNYSRKLVKDKEVSVKRDVVGMLMWVHEYIENNGLNSGKKKVFLFIASNMKPTVLINNSKEQLRKYIEKHADQLKFRNTEIYILGKLNVCEDIPEMARNELYLTYKKLWKQVIKVTNGKLHYLTVEY